MEKYTVDYYKSINEEEAPQAKKLGELLQKMYKPVESVVDIGCGTGLYLKEFKGIQYGFDISEDAFDETVIQVQRNLVDIRDLTKPMNVPLKSSLALCLEVVEHIGDENVDILVENLCKWSDLIVMTASPPGQAGLNHVNCQPQKYWDEKFEAMGYRRDYHDEYQIVSELDKIPHTTWIIRNLMVYKKI